VTLIAGFQCTDGAIVVADSQETVGNYRVSCQKISPVEAANFEVVIAGSGNGDLVDAFVQRIQDELENADVNTPREFKKFAQEQLLDFLRNEASLHPKKDRDMRLMVAGHSRTLPALFGMWESRSSRLIPVQKYSLVGFEAPIYRHAVDRLFIEPIPISRAIPLAMYLFSLAEDTSNYVKSPVSIVIITGNSPMFSETKETIEDFEAMAQVYMAALERMFLVCADTRTSSATFSKQFGTFTETILRLRWDYLQAAGKRQSDGFFIGRWPDTPYRTLPPESTVTILGEGSGTVKEEHEITGTIKEIAHEIEKSAEKIAEKIKQSASEKSGLEP
jgi:hypothetical protein